MILHSVPTAIIIIIIIIIINIRIITTNTVYVFLGMQTIIL